MNQKRQDEMRDCVREEEKKEENREGVKIIDEQNKRTEKRLEKRKE